MATDVSHHHNGISSFLEAIEPDLSVRAKPNSNFLINDAKVMFMESPFAKHQLIEVLKDVPCEMCTKEKPGVCKYCQGSTLLPKRPGLPYPPKGIPCPICAENPGKCKFCKGTGKVDEPVYDTRDRKDWGAVLSRLIGNPSLSQIGQ